MAKFLRYIKEVWAPTSWSTPLWDAANVFTRPIRAVPNWYIRAYNNIAALYNNKVANKELEKSKKENEKAIKKNEAINNIRNLTKDSLINQYSWFDVNEFIDNTKTNIRWDTNYSKRLESIYWTYTRWADWSDHNVIDSKKYYREWQWKLWNALLPVQNHNPITSWWINLLWNSYTLNNKDWINYYTDNNWNVVPNSKLKNLIKEELTSKIDYDKLKELEDEMDLDPIYWTQKVYHKRSI